MAENRLLKEFIAFNSDETLPVRIPLLQLSIEKLNRAYR
jgi:hypothetical protein